MNYTSIRNKKITNCLGLAIAFSDKMRTMSIIKLISIGKFTLAVFYTSSDCYQYSIIDDYGSDELIAQFISFCESNEDFSTLIVCRLSVWDSQNLVGSREREKREREGISSKRLFTF